MYMNTRRQIVTAVISILIQYICNDVHTRKTVSGDFIDVGSVFTKMRKCHGDVMSRDHLCRSCYTERCA